VELKSTHNSPESCTGLISRPRRRTGSQASRSGRGYPPEKSKFAASAGEFRIQSPGQLGQWITSGSVNQNLQAIDLFEFRGGLFHCRRGDETIGVANETIFRLQCRTPETADGYQATNK
jgi:hypothetical protein